MGVKIHVLPSGPIQTIGYLLTEAKLGAAVLVDAPGGILAKIQPLLAQEGCALKELWLTHGHWDHIQAVTQMRDAGYSVAVTQADATMLPSYDEILEDDEVLTVGRLRLRTIATPGHTPGSMCFHLEGSPVLFSGDTLFPGGPGATRFEGSSFAKIIESIDLRLFPLAPDTIVLPGHGVDTTIATERPSLQSWVDRGW